MWYIYKIVNNKTNDCYVGSTIDIVRRKRTHFYQLEKNKHHSRHLQNAYNFYSAEVFELIVLEEINEFYGIQFLLDAEQKWMNCLNSSYNTMKDIKSHYGLKRSLETRQKISKANTGKHQSDETREKLRLANLGKKYSKKTKLKHSISSKKFWSKITDHEKSILTEKIQKTKIEKGLTKSVEKYDLSNNFICKYSSLQKAEHANTLPKDCLRRFLYRGKNIPYHGFLWKLC